MMCRTGRMSALQCQGADIDLGRGIGAVEVVAMALPEVWSHCQRGGCHKGEPQSCNDAVHHDFVLPDLAGLNRLPGRKARMIAVKNTPAVQSRRSCQFMHEAGHF